MSALSRIGKYQRARADAGFCRYCDLPAVALGLCRAHQEYNRTSARNHYRHRHGISLSAPLSGTGRPRLGAEASLARLHEILANTQVSPTTSNNGQPKNRSTRS